MALQRFMPREGTALSSSGPATSCPWSGKYPTVVEFLSTSLWPDGAKRETGTITLLCDSGLAKAALNDRDANVSAFLSAESWTALFKALEEGLAGGRLEWRAKKEYGPRRK